MTMIPFKPRPVFPAKKVVATNLTRLRRRRRDLITCLRIGSWFLFAALWYKPAVVVIVSVCSAFHPSRLVLQASTRRRPQARTRSRSHRTLLPLQQLPPHLPALASIRRAAAPDDTMEEETMVENDNMSLGSSIATNDALKDPTTLISAQSPTIQQLVFVGLCGGILTGSFGFVALYNQCEMVLPPSIFAPFYTVLPYVLGTAFTAAGIAHFVFETTFTSFVPPKGSWGGLWQIPAPLSERVFKLSYAQYHSYWTGIAEIVAGVSLIVTTARGDGDPTGTLLPSLALYGITLLVTPANIYMYTHNPVVPRIPPLPYPYGHLGRGVLQCALLGVFFKFILHALAATAAAAPILGQ